MNEQVAPDGIEPRCDTRCPLCGGPNGCVPARTGSFDQACWCAEVKFSADLLARVPPAQRGKACVCRRCAEGPSGLAGQGAS